MTITVRDVMSTQIVAVRRGATFKEMAAALREHRISGFPVIDDEAKVIGLTTTTRVAEVQAVTNAEEILDFQKLVRMVPIADSLAKYVVSVVRATRPKNTEAPEAVKKYVNYGASVRAAQFIVLSAKARALSRRRYHVAYEDILAMAIPVLRHRILLNFHAESDRIDSDEILRRLLEYMPPPKGA